MNAFETAITQTIIYLDICNFAPTVTELCRYLLYTDKPHTLFDIMHTVHKSPLLERKDGYIFLRGKKHLVERRREAYLFTEQKKDAHKWIIRLLSAMPGVRGIWLCNTLGWGNAHKNSDTDICIVTAQQRIWTARLFTTAILKILRRRPGECAREKAICPSFYIVDSLEDLGKYRLDDEDIHYAYWITQMTPLYNTELFIEWSKKQYFARSFFSHESFLLPTERHTITLPRWITYIREKVEALCPEKLFNTLQIRVMPKHILRGKEAGVVVLNDAILKLHTHDTRAELKNLFTTSCRQLGVSEHLRFRS